MKLEFNEHQRDVFCVFSGVGVQRLRGYLNTDTSHRRNPVFEDGTGFDDGPGDHDMMMNVTAQAHGMGIDDNMDEDFGDGSELMGDN